MSCVPSLWGSTHSAVKVSTAEERHKVYCYSLPSQAFILQDIPCLVICSRIYITQDLIKDYPTKKIGFFNYCFAEEHSAEEAAAPSLCNPTSSKWY